ncbi:hypothetical protein BJ508DRAFT_134217 [Ascobolus immersus RN42]|uniref:AAA+ ATPase domain-containing protein n=1 Tax=Ascobolus immersus RN42 TaxID=1160509 RepID=A0A3N4IK02_ASCIM|nr:hypothetical protein BJ508DRAFT_134217 [Ascobolus immersus RN42]
MPTEAVISGSSAAVSHDEDVTKHTVDRKNEEQSVVAPQKTASSLGTPATSIASLEEPDEISTKDAKDSEANHLTGQPKEEQNPLITLSTAGSGEAQEKSKEKAQPKTEPKSTVLSDNEIDGYVSDGVDLEKEKHEWMPMSALERNLPRSTEPKYIKKRRNQAAKRLKQHRDYTLAIEERIRYLEKTFAQIPDEPEASKETPDNEKVPATICKALRLNWTEYKELRKTRKSLKMLNAIEVLEEEPNIDYSPPDWTVNIGITQVTVLNQRKEGQTDSRDDISSAFQQFEPSPAPLNVGSSNLHSQLPDRIRINSVPLIRILKNLREFTAPTDAEFVVHRPFRVLLHHANDLRVWRNRIAKSKGYASIDEAPSSKSTADATNTEAHASNRKDQAIHPSTTSEEQQRECPAGTETVQAMEDIDCLLEVIKQIEEHKNKLEETRLISFDDLWYIFKPGDDVISITDDTPQVYRVVQVTGVRHGISSNTNSGGKGNGWLGSEVKVHCKFMDAVGKQIGPVCKVFDIPKFAGTQKVTALPVYPFRFAEDQAKTHQKLVTRGRRFLELLRIKHVQSRRNTTTLESKEMVDSQVMVDFEQALQHKQSWTPTLDARVSDPSALPFVEEQWKGCGLEGCCAAGDGASFNDLPIDLLRAREVSRKTVNLDEELVLFTHRVFGFILRNRKWAKFHIDDLINLDRYNPKEGYARLVLPPGHKRTVRALVEQHFDAKESKFQDEHQIDIVKGKGKGLIILLHGAPGVGKTSTAETIAEKFARPLYPITCGDLGTTPTEVESKLELSFTLAHRWGCILLLDEADIFLGERTREDFLRNSLVSVFLRVLEYYSGILFLTTNRVGALDEAFKSRIHLSLYYPPLEWDATQKIWLMNLEWTEKQRPYIQLKKNAIMAFALKHFGPDSKNTSKVQPWNGRQIRNAFQTAIALAESEAKRIRKRKHENSLKKAQKSKEKRKKKSGKKDSESEAEGSRKKKSTAEALELDSDGEAIFPEKSKPSSKDESTRTVLKPAHFATVVTASLEFDKYMQQVHRKSDGKRALEANMRFDKYDSAKPQKSGPFKGTEKKSKRKQDTDKKRSSNSTSQKRTRKSSKRETVESDAQDSDEEEDDSDAVEDDEEEDVDSENDDEEEEEAPSADNSDEDDSEAGSGSDDDDSASDGEDGMDAEDLQSGEEESDDEETIPKKGKIGKKDKEHVKEKQKEKEPVKTKAKDKSKSSAKTGGTTKKKTKS